MYLSHPNTCTTNKILFQLEYLKTFFTPKFLYAYLDFRISNKVKEYMKNDYLLNDIPLSYNLKGNEIKFTEFENNIKLNPTIFYNNTKMQVFYKRDSNQVISKKVIETEQLKLLTEIQEVFKENKTNCKIVISPLYNQIKINEADVVLLKRIFGDMNVFDFSGINTITNDYHNYYESSHYRPHITNLIMQEIYKN